MFEKQKGDSAENINASLYLDPVAISFRDVPILTNTCSTSTIFTG
jgi:hypothetical protein